MTSNLNADLTIFVLCGGQSSRMGTNKAFLDAGNGKSMVETIISTVRKLETKVILVGSYDEYGSLGQPVIEDHFQNRGPLGGLHRALTYTQTSQNVILSCDIPFISTAVLTTLVREHRPDRYDMTIARMDGQIHPLIGIYNKNLNLKVTKAIDSDQLSMRKFIVQCRCQFIEFENEKSFININTTEEYQEFINQQPWQL